MVDSRVEKLTERQRQILRLIRPGFTTDMIVAELGGNRETIETHIKRARALLGGVSRFEAAEILRREENRSHQSMGTHRMGIARSVTEEASLSLQSQYDDDEDEHLPTRVSEPHWEEAAPRRDTIQPPFEWQGRRVSSMSKGQRFVWTMVLVCLLVIAVGVFVTAADGLRNIFWSYRSQN